MPVAHAEATLMTSGTAIPIVRNAARVTHLATGVDATQLGKRTILVTSAARATFSIASVGTSLSLSLITETVVIKGGRSCVERVFACIAETTCLSS